MNQNIKNALLLFVLFLFILSIARPVMDKKEHKIKEELIPIIIAIDVSKSMLANDIYPNRLSLAKQKLLKIIKNSKHSALGVVLFAKSAFVLSPVTQDFTSLTFLVNNLDAGLNFDNGSNVMAMLEASADLLENFGSKNIILLSDGGNKSNYDKETEFATSNNIKIYAIAVGTDKHSPIPTKEGYLTDDKGKIVTVGLNKSIAKLGLDSGGGYIDFSLNENDINAILVDIASVAKKESMNSTNIKTYTELFYYPLALSVLLLLICFSSLPRRKAQTLGVTAFTLLALSFSTTPVKAAILDFQTLKDAKESYENKNFKKAEESYKKVNKNAQTNYNLANSLYKQGNYKEALDTYKNIKTQDKNLEYQTLHNMGNTYVKQKDLKNAQSMYEKALKLKKDEQTKQNLETVKKALKQQQKKDNKDNKDDKNKKDNKKKEDKNNKDKKQDQKKNQKDSDKKDKNKDKKKDKKQNKKESKEDKSKQSQAQKEKEKKKEEKKKASQQQKSQQAQKQKIISDMEEKKWLNQIKKRKNKTFLRKVESESSEENIKNPW